MTTSLNSARSIRDKGQQEPLFLRKTINVSDVPTGTLVQVGKIPAEALIVDGISGLYVTVEYTGTTNVIDVGYADEGGGSTDVNAYASAVVLPITTAGHFLALDELAASTARPRAVATAVTATWTGTASTGSVDVVIGYICNTDQ